MSVPLELPAFLYTRSRLGIGGREEGREGGREMECSERWVNYVAHLVKL